MVFQNVHNYLFAVMCTSNTCFDRMYRSINKNIHVQNHDLFCKHQRNLKGTLFSINETYTQQIYLNYYIEYTCLISNNRVSHIKEPVDSISINTLFGKVIKTKKKHSRVWNVWNQKPTTATIGLIHSANLGVCLLIMVTILTNTSILY